ncbi:hypothetical protein GCM10010185_62650 [Saccharothrix coeruleofusca]|uniref:Uncharacterized protein n=1 Tax=Saccharothrix coeruleofusca TaxID=33919 RepID=A0A918EHS9_9PSEU|nr:hypothetical protein GCM10010185_62650 [Saccharothrix coeruleofusca]
MPPLTVHRYEDVAVLGEESGVQIRVPNPFAPHGQGRRKGGAPPPERTAEPRQGVRVLPQADSAHPDLLRRPAYRVEVTFSIR